ncbi:MAG: NAD(P)-dependent alcohol dehydrogenase [Sphingomonas bacterium]|nr:NAD(P)-dependent alcohol dehydrogenase [Sphingomonas bacterium]
MRSWIVEAGSTDLGGLKLVERDRPAPGPGEVLIRVHACSINYRDQLVPLGRYFGGVLSAEQVP